MTRMELDTAKRSTMRALMMPNLLHGAVESSLSGGRDRNLWRIDPLGGKTYLMLLSVREPDLSEAVRQFGVSGDGPGWETRDYTPLLNRIQDGTVWHFRLAANPVKSCLDDKKNLEHTRGTIHAHVSVPFQEEWLSKRDEKNGFTLAKDAFRVVHSQWFHFLKGGDQKHLVSLLSVTYEGVLTVSNAETFRHTLTRGIGRGKAYGLGMLTVVRLRGPGYV